MLQEELDPTMTTLLPGSLGTIDYTSATAENMHFDVDVLSTLEADTDGIVQFVLHDSSGYVEFATHLTALGEDYWPRLDFLLAPLGADNPYPCPAAIVPTTLEGLSWSNPDPNDGISDITCTVYLGTEPNRLQMEDFELSPNAHAVLINPTNFPTYGTLQNLEKYYWTVDCYDPSAGVIEGLMWDFTVNDNAAPPRRCRFASGCLAGPRAARRIRNWSI